MKRILPVVMILLLCATLLFGCNRTPAPEEFGMQLSAPKEGDTIAVFVTDLGTFKAVLFPEQAPLAVDNFVQLAESGYYNGLIYHRVVPDFVIQTGDPTGSGSGGESASGSYFNNEYSPVLHHFNGALGMANSAENMNASQFYVVSSSPVSENLIHQMELKGAQEGYDDTVINAYKTIGGRPTLDYLYTVFGQVYEGMDTVEKINGVPTDENDRPLDDVKLLSVLIETYTA